MVRYVERQHHLPKTAELVEPPDSSAEPHYPKVLTLQTVDNITLQGRPETSIKEIHPRE